MGRNPRFATALAALLALSPALAAAQAPVVVVVPWGTGEVDPAAMQRAAESTTLAVPASAGSAVSVSETRARFEATGSTAAPTVTSAELDQWTQYSRQAVSELANADYPAALEALRRAQEISDRAAAAMSREEERARQVLDTCLFGVRAYVEQEDPHATEQMMSCRRLVPGNVAPSPRIHTPEVVDLLARVDARLAAAHRGPLVVESQPAGCAVRLNGVRMGQTPFTSEQLAPGEYRVQVECGEGARARVHRVTIEDAASPVTLSVDARFDAAVSTESALHLAYADADDAAAHRALDALAIGRVLGAAEVWLVGVATDGTMIGDRVRVEDGTSVASVAGAASTTALVTALVGAPATDHGGGGGGGEVDAGAWALVGTGGALVVAGAVLLGVGAPDFSATETPRAGESYTSAAGRESTATALVGAGGAALGVGAVLAGIGIGWAVAGGGEHESRSVSLRVTPTGLSVSGSF
ncbi:MAG: PEGA domain-containing protein [Sandaracinus sp.]